MKQLDEVIKANECCDHGDLDSKCEDCPYSGIGACCRERESDALYYLKHLQEYYNMSREYYELNPPLTWDELKQMIGKPVWTEIITVPEYSQWRIITGKIFEDHIFKREYGKLWQAYRKECK